MKRRSQLRFTRDGSAGVPEPEHPRDRRRRATTAIGVLVLAMAALSPVWWASDHTATGTAHALTSGVTPTSSAPTANRSASPESPPTRRGAATPDASGTSEVPGATHGQQPGTIRLPRGGTADLVHKEVDGTTSVLPVPDDLSEATWWGAGLGAEHGASVFAGHVNWGGRTGPFAELWQAAAGDDLTVVDDSGKEWRYEVTEARTIDKDDLADEAVELFGQQEQHRVVLVTCGGRWTGGDEGYSQNRVVIAHKPAD